MALQLATAAAGVLRDRHYVRNPVSGLYERSTLLEGSRTNLVLRSGAIGGASWTQGRLTATLDALTAPDGTATATRLVEDGQNATHRVYQTFPGAAVATYTASVYLKAGERTRAQLMLGSAAESLRASVDVDLVAGTITGGAGTITPLSDGWFRVTTTGALDAADTGAGIYVYPLNAAGARSFPGDTVSGLYVWGAQLEQAPFASSYIPTVAAAATRAADPLSFPFPWAPQEMTLYTKFIERGTAQLASSSFGLLGISGIGNRLGVWGSGTFPGSYRTETVLGGTFISAQANNPVAIGDLVEVIITLLATGAHRLGIARNGGALVESTTGAPPGGMPAAWGAPTLFVGSRAANTTGFNAFLEKGGVKVARGIKSLDQMRRLPPVS